MCKASKEEAFDFFFHAVYIIYGTNWPVRRVNDPKDSNREKWRAYCASRFSGVAEF